MGAFAQIFRYNKMKLQVPEQKFWDHFDKMMELPFVFSIYHFRMGFHQF